MAVEVALYRDGRWTTVAGGVEALKSAREQGGFLWVDLEEPSMAVWSGVAAAFGLDDIAWENVIERRRRPTLELHGETVFLALKTAEFDATTAKVDGGDLLAVAGQDFAVTVRFGDGCGADELRRRVAAVELGEEPGPEAVLYAVIELAVAGYGPTVAGLEGAVAAVETEVFAGDRDVSPRIYRLSRAVAALHRAAGPMAEAVDRLLAGEIGDLDEDVARQLRPYLRQVRDRVLRLDERLVDLRELLADLLSVNLSLTSTRMNDRRQDSAQRISAWAAILAVPAVVTGVYGMNFRAMPELAWTWGYPFALGLILLIGLLLFQAFRRSGWL